MVKKDILNLQNNHSLKWVGKKLLLLTAANINNLIMEKSNKIIQYLVKTGKIEATGLPHFGGKQYIYKSVDNSGLEGNINIMKLGEVIYDMTDEDIQLLLKFIN